MLRITKIQTLNIILQYLHNYFISVSLIKSLRLQQTITAETHTRTILIAQYRDTPVQLLTIFPLFSFRHVWRHQEQFSIIIPLPPIKKTIFSDYATNKT